MENKLSEMIQTSLENIKNLVGADTIVGQSIQAGNGTTIIPISKVSLGFASGGVDFGKKNKAAENVSQQKPGDKNNFGGGGGTGLTVVPICFLVVKADGNVEILNVPTQSGDTGIVGAVSDIVEKTPDIISKIKNVFKKDKDTAAEE